MAKKYTWPDGKGAVHSISWAQHVKNRIGDPAKQTIGARPGAQPWVVPGPDPASANPAPDAQPEPGPLPDPAFMAQQAAAQRQLQLGGVWDKYQLGQIENSYGLGVDVSNPFSRANLLQQQYQRGQRGTEQSYAQQGQLHAGAYQNARNFNAGQYSQQYDALKRQYQGEKAGVIQGQIARYGSTIGNVSQQDMDSVIRALGALS